MRYFLGGINGSGKTTLLAGIKEAAPRFETVRGSYALMKLVGAKDHDALRAVDQDDLLVKHAELLKELFRMHSDLIIDSHYLNLEQGRVVPRTGPFLKDFDALLLLNVSAQTILDRIAGDPRRVDALFPAGMTAEQQKAMLETYLTQTTQEFLRIAALYDLPHLVLDGGKPTGEIVKDFLAFDDGLRKNVAK